MMLRLKNIRQEHKLTQVEVAQRLNMSPARYNNYEVNKAEPDIDTLCKLADLYNTSIDFLVGRECDILNLKFLQPEQSSLIKKILAMNTLQQLRTTAYVAGLLGE